MDNQKKIKIIDVSILVLCISIDVINHLYGKYIHVSFISYILKCYFNDFLGGIAFLAYVNYILSFYVKGPIRIRSYYQIFLLSALCSIFWEVITPMFIVSTADWMDFVAYTLGATTYWFFDNYVTIRFSNTTHSLS